MLGIFKVGTAVVVDFEYLAFGCLYVVVVTVAALPPSLSAKIDPAESVVRPVIDYLRDNIFPLAEFKRNRSLYLAADCNLDILSDELRSHHIFS